MASILPAPAWCCDTAAQHDQLGSRRLGRASGRSESICKSDCDCCIQRYQLCSRRQCHKCFQFVFSRRFLDFRPEPPNRLHAGRFCRCASRLLFENGRLHWRVFIVCFRTRVRRGERVSHRHGAWVRWERYSVYRPVCIGEGLDRNQRHSYRD